MSFCPSVTKLGDVLDHFHLRAVEAHAVDVEAFGRFLDVGGNAVDQRVLAALRAVDPFKAAHRIGARERAQVMRDRIVVAVVPVGDPGERAAGVEVHRIGAAAELGRHQQHPVAEFSTAHVGLRIDQLAIDGMALWLGRDGSTGPEPAVRRGLSGNHGIAEHDGFADRGRPRRPGEDAAAIEFRRRFLRRIGRLRDLLFIANFFLLQVAGEILVVLLQHLGFAAQIELFRRERLLRRARRLARQLDLHLGTALHCFLQFRPASLSHGPAPFVCICG